MGFHQQMVQVAVVVAPAANKALAQRLVPLAMERQPFSAALAVAQLPEIVPLLGLVETACLVGMLALRGAVPDKRRVVVERPQVAQVRAARSGFGYETGRNKRRLDHQRDRGEP